MQPMTIKTVPSVLNETSQVLGSVIISVAIIFPVIQLCGTVVDVWLLCAYHCHSNTIVRKQNSTQSLV